MKDEKKETGEELIDIDEKGNPTEKEKEEKKDTSNSSFKIIIALIICLIILASCYFFFFNKKDVFGKTTLKNLKLKNRVFFGPITHDIEKIEPAAKNDVALVIIEGAVDVVHKYNSYIILDLVHPGLIALELCFIVRVKIKVSFMPK